MPGCTSGTEKAETTSQAYEKLGFQRWQGSPGLTKRDEEEQGRNRLRHVGRSALL